MNSSITAPPSKEVVIGELSEKEIDKTKKDAKVKKSKESKSNEKIAKEKAQKAAAKQTADKKKQASAEQIAAAKKSKKAESAKKKAVPKSDPKFKTCTEAIKAGYGNYGKSDPEYSWYQDRDKDGMVCEN